MTLKAFQPAIISGLSLKNRIVMAPMTRRGAPAKDGVPTPEIVNYYTKRSQGDVGLIISEGIHVDDTHSVDDFNTPRMHNEQQAEGWLKVTESVHKYGGKFAVQLWHTGRYAIDPIAPTAVKMDDPRSQKVPKEMDQSQLKDVKDKFVKAAILAEKAGCDAVELHGAHGYLLDSFLCPTNTRSDGYGKSIENRLKYPFEVIAEVKRAIKIPVIYRFSQWGWLGEYKYKKFRTSQELGTVIQTLDKAGVDIFHVSTYRVAEPGFENEDKSLSLGGWVKNYTKKSVIGVGGVNCSSDFTKMFNPEDKQTLVHANKELGLVEKGEIDMLAVGRALISNPNWVQLVQSNQQDKLIPFDKVMLGKLE